MSTQSKNASDPVLANLDRLLSDLEAFYKNVHSHPELSMQETRTAGLAADRFRKAGYEVTTGIGKTGVVGRLRNGAGPTVMLRADMDALPTAADSLQIRLFGCGAHGSMPQATGSTGSSSAHSSHR
jgi:metal-dependent amidase/aminoacylase/carboxypeptidase family protein